MLLLDGKIASTHFLENIQRVVASTVKAGEMLYLAVILVGDDPRSLAYVRAKKKTCESLGFGFELVAMPLDVSEEHLLKEITRLNRDGRISGIIVQLPVPPHINPSLLINAISPDKDVDGFTSHNMGRLIVGESCFVPATPLGVLMLLQYYHIQTAGKRIAILGRSHIVGRPLSILLSQNHSLGNATVTLCHQHTQNVENITREADIIIVAIGKPLFLRGDMVRQGSVIIDVGINAVQPKDTHIKPTLVGDAHFEELQHKVSAITPVPGGVGRMTIAGLLFNTFSAFCQQGHIAVNAEHIFSF